MSIFKKIGAFFVGLFNSAKAAYLELSEEDKVALQGGTGIVEIINTMKGAAVSEIRAAIQAKFPAYDEATLEAALIQVGNTFLGSSYANGDAVIEAAQAKLIGLKNSNPKAWAVASHGIAALFAALLGSPATKVATFTSLIEFVFQTFIKKSVKHEEAV